MKSNWYYGACIVLMGMHLTGCSNTPHGKAGLEEDNQTVAKTIQQKAQEEQSKEVAAVSMWDQVSVKETPDHKGKWLTSLSIGESLTFLGEKATDTKDDNHEYLKIRLNDGKEGWTRADFVAPGAQAAVFTKEANLYKRPDLLTKSDHVFSQMDIAAVVETQDDWLKIRGKRSQGKWIEEGWVKADNISYEAVDIATAKFGKKALENKDEDKKTAAIQEIINNSDLKTSVFMAKLQAMISVQEAAELEGEMISEYIPVLDSIQ